ncbi:hypothetical protein KSP40_PGU008745 [Platanthera guangdongensis]|uniref:Uncharacterized protein n=1 Tax=Platanthera guangdongensis TaxID=2320717 RepID=A0ABR2M0V7_9ASPA
MSKCRSHGTFPHFNLQSSHLNICDYHQDPHQRPLPTSSRPEFHSSNNALLVIKKTFPRDLDHVAGGCQRQLAVGHEILRWGERLPLGWSWDDITTSALQVSEAGLALVRLLCYTIYPCWRSRNAYTHGYEVGTPAVIAATVLENIAIFDQGRNSGCWGTSRPSGIFHSPSWCPRCQVG